MLVQNVRHKYLKTYLKSINLVLSFAEFVGRSTICRKKTSLTDEFDEEAAIVYQYSLPMNLDVHLDKHLNSVRMAYNQHFPTCCRDGTEGAPAAVFISAQDRGKWEHCDNNIVF